MQRCVVRCAWCPRRLRSLATTRIAASATVSSANATASRALPSNGQQFERRRDVGNRLGADRFVRDQQRRQLGDLGKRIADRSGIRIGDSRCDACRTQRPRGVLRHPREGLGKFQGL